MEPTKTSAKELRPEQFTAPDYKPGIVRQIVLLHYKAGVSDAQRMVIMERFRNLQNTALRNGQPYIVSIESGPQISSEGLDQKFGQVFIVQFRSEGDRNYYVGPPAVTDPAYYDPSHQKLKDMIMPLLDEHGIMVFDFTPNN